MIPIVGSKRVRILYLNGYLRCGSISKKSSYAFCVNVMIQAVYLYIISVSTIEGDLLTIFVVLIIQNLHVT